MRPKLFHSFVWDQPNFLLSLRHCRSYVCFVKRPQKISYFIIICAKIKATFYICFTLIWIFLNCNQLSISDSFMVPKLYFFMLNLSLTWKRIKNKIEIWWTYKRLYISLNEVILRQFSALVSLCFCWHNPKN